MPGDHPRICLVSASQENVFFGEILDAFGDALAAHGFTVEHSVDCFPAPADDLVCLFIPHEYMALVDPLAHPSLTQLSRSVAISTEQPGTSWFDTAFEFAQFAGAVVDINPLAAEEMRRRGVQADHAQLGYIPAWDVWGGERDKERPIDLAFLGRFTAERGQMIARCRPALERRRAALYLTETVKPHMKDAAYYLSGTRRSELLADSKLLINIHQQTLPYLEWHRILSAVLNGCVVLTEHSLMTEPFQPGEHFISGRLADLPLLLEGLLEEPERLERIRHDAYELVKSAMPMSAAVEVMIGAIERAAGNPVRFGAAGPAPVVPIPVRLPEPKPGWQSYVEEVGAELPVRRGLMDLVTRTRSLERRVGELISEATAEPTVEVTEFGPPIEKPRVSVLLTVYNHADLVAEGIRSVAFGEWDDLELIAVDDASTDDSAAVIEATLAELPWLSAKLVRRSVNSGLPASSRNLAFEHARGELLFILDADNTVLPLGISKLVAAVDADPEAAFAYGIIEKFDITGPIGIESFLDWDPERLRYGNYVDAMALIRRGALDTVGGYSEAPALGGWEDYALWVAMAERDMRAVRIPDFIGRYRVSQYSMLSVIGIDHSTAWTTLLRNYPHTMRG
ncbi:MAG TPA: glycosyltransferase family 2 protein [Solirubrobacterales bacterium]|nr:glycosyltransferase family 2 protein [Solirubrobacterales bacterium]